MARPSWRALAVLLAPVVFAVAAYAQKPLTWQEVCVESRVPLLDHHFVEFAASIPDKWKLRNGTGKYILKRALENLLLREIVYRKKMGFPTPLRQWFMDPRAEGLYSLLFRRDGLLATCIDSRYMERLLSLHRAGAEYATDRIWRRSTCRFGATCSSPASVTRCVWEGLLMEPAVSAR